MKHNIGGLEDDGYVEAVADAAIGFTERRRQLRRELQAIWRECIGAGARCTSERAPAPLPPDARARRQARDAQRAEVKRAREASVTTAGGAAQ